MATFEELMEAKKREYGMFDKPVMEKKVDSKPILTPQQRAAIAKAQYQEAYYKQKMSRLRPQKRMKMKPMRKKAEPTIRKEDIEKAAKYAKQGVKAGKGLLAKAREKFGKPKKGFPKAKY